MAGKWKLADLLKKYTPQKLSVKIYGQQVSVEAVEREVFLRGFQPLVKVVVTKGKKEPIIFLSTDLRLTAAQIIEIYAARFSIELALRDLKQHFGLAHYQCYLGIAIDRFVHLACKSLLPFWLIPTGTTKVRLDATSFCPSFHFEFLPSSSRTSTFCH